MTGEPLIELVVQATTDATHVVMQDTIEGATMRAQLDGGELLRFNYVPSPLLYELPDPETVLSHDEAVAAGVGCWHCEELAREQRRVYARLVIEFLPAPEDGETPEAWKARTRR